MPSCTFDLQLANEEILEKGLASSSEILAAFDAFDWPGQVDEANRLQGCSPTFSVREPEAQRHFWVSAAGEPTDFVFVNEYTYRGPDRKLLGLRRPARIVSAPTHDLALETARDCIELFVRGEHERLLDRLATG